VSGLTGFQRLCIITCVVVFGLIVVGGVVRSTDSGEGCPDWPLCHGRLIPENNKHTLIEYSHRATASVTGILVLAITVWAWRAYRNVPRILYPAVLALVLVVFQAGLGGAAVASDLAAEIVMVHLGTALCILALLVLIAITSIDLERPLVRPRLSANTGRLALLASAATLVLMLIGAYVAVADYALACSGWPLCNGEVVPSAHVASVQVIFGHRVVALVLGLVIVGLVWQVWRQRHEAPLAFALVLTAGAVYVAQVFIGAANIWTDVADEVSATHLAFGTLLWLVLAILNIRLFALHEWLPRSSGEHQSHDLAHGATR
jgi:heme A synthase